MELVIFHIPLSSTVDNRSHFPERGKIPDRLANAAVHRLPLMLHEQEVIGPIITDRFLHGLSQLLHARGGTQDLYGLSSRFNFS
jgi:hypothetical protein